MSTKRTTRRLMTYLLFRINSYILFPGPLQVGVECEEKLSTGKIS